MLQPPGEQSDRSFYSHPIAGRTICRFSGDLSNRSQSALSAAVGCSDRGLLSLQRPLQNRYSAEIPKQIQPYTLDRLISYLWVGGSNPSRRANEIKGFWIC
jgi:hypothetical protein